MKDFKDKNIVFMSFILLAYFIIIYQSEHFSQKQWIYI